MLGGTVQNSLEGEGPWENGEGPEVPRHCVLIAKNISCLWLCSVPRFNN